MKIYLLLLAVVQGITEFLPLSSSGHLVLIEKFSKITSHKLSVIVYLHIATLLAVIVYFRREIIKALKNRKYLGYILIAFAFTAIVAYFLKNFIFYFMENSIYLGMAFLITSGFLFITDKINHENYKRLNLSLAIVIGLIQGVAVIPGISRSGITVAMGVILGLSREEAFKFSFLLAIPTLISAGIYEFKDMEKFWNHYSFPISFISFILTFLTALVAIYVFRRILLHKKLSIFGLYCCIIGLIILVTGGWR